MRRLIPLVLAFLLASCGDERSMGGGGFGGETVTGRVVDADGAGIAGARVRLRSSRSVDAAVLAEAVSDDSGRYRLDAVPSIPLRMEVAARVKTDSVVASAAVDPNRAPARVVASRPIARRVRLVFADGGPLAATIQAYGWGASVRSDDSGVLRLTGWPASDMWVRVDPHAGGEAMDLLLPAMDTGEIVVRTGWLLDDFESGEERTRFGTLVGGGWWYGASRGEDSTQPQSSYARSFRTAWDSTDSRSGRRSLHLRYDFGTDPRRYGLVGHGLAPRLDGVVDWSGVDSLEFWTRGSVAFRLELAARAGDAVHRFSASIGPFATWTRVVVRLADLTPEVAGESWSGFAPGVSTMQFLVFDDGDIWLDDIRLHARRLP